MTLAGPYKAVYTFNTPSSPITVTFIAQAGITLDFSAPTNDILVDGLGVVDQFNSEVTCAISWAHDGYFDSAMVAYLSSFASMLPGENLHKDSTLVLTSLLSSRSIYTFRNVAPTGLPSLKLSSRGVMNGSIAFLATCKSTMLPGEAESLFAITTGGGAAAIPARDPSGYITGLPTLSMSSDSENALYAFYAREGVDVNFNFSATPVNGEHVGVMRHLFKDVSAQASFIPDGGTLTEANVLAAMLVQASTGAMGARRGGSDPLTILQPVVGLSLSLPRPVITMNKHMASSATMLQNAVTVKTSRGANSGGAIAAAYSISLND